MDYETVRANGGPNLPGVVSNRVSTMRRKPSKNQVCPAPMVKAPPKKTTAPAAVDPATEDPTPLALKFHAYFVENSGERTQAGFVGRVRRRERLARR